MKFVVYRYTDAPDNFLVTDEAHRGTVKHDAGADDRELEEIGIYDEMGEERAAFNETLAKDSIWPKTQLRPRGFIVSRPRPGIQSRKPQRSCPSNNATYAVETLRRLAGDGRRLKHFISSSTRKTRDKTDTDRNGLESPLLLAAFEPGPHL